MAKIWPAVRFAFLVFVIGIGLNGVSFTSPVLAQTNKTLPVSETTPVPSYCLHTVSLRLPHCRGKLILLILKRWVETHFEWDTRRWAMPLYVEFDQIGQWQRVTFLSLHVNRRVP